MNKIKYETIIIVKAEIAFCKSKIHRFDIRILYNRCNLILPKILRKTTISPVSSGSSSSGSSSRGSSSRGSSSSSGRK